MPAWLDIIVQFQSVMVSCSVRRKCWYPDETYLNPAQSYTNIYICFFVATSLYYRINLKACSNLQFFKYSMYVLWCFQLCDERYQKVQVELKHTVEILHEEQERIIKIEAIKKSLEIEVKNISVRLEEVEANAIVGGKRIISKLESRVSLNSPHILDL